MKGRLTALLCAVVLCLHLVPTRAINVGDVYFTGVNDKLLGLAMDTMPTWVNGVLYVPASVFDSTVTGVDLGLFCIRSSTNNVVTLYTLRQMLVFDLSRGTAYDQHSGQNLSARAINRNGRIYLPVAAVCNFFGLEDSYHYTQYGYLVRIKSDSARLGDEEFLEKAGGQMESRLDALLQSQAPSTQPSTPPEVVLDPDEQPKARIQVYLAVRCETGEGLERILTLLERENCRGIFFFDTELLSGQDDLVRRVIGTGHSIGLLVEENAAGENRQRLARGNELLGHVARTGATAALVPADQRQALEEDGWACWQETVSGLPRENERAAAYANRIIKAIGTRSRRVYLTLDDSKTTADVLPALFQKMEQEQYSIITPLETRL